MIINPYTTWRLGINDDDTIHDFILIGDATTNDLCGNEKGAESINQASTLTLTQHPDTLKITLMSHGYYYHDKM